MSEDKKVVKLPIKLPAALKKNLDVQKEINIRSLHNEILCGLKKGVNVSPEKQTKGDGLVYVTTIRLPIDLYNDIKSMATEKKISIHAEMLGRVVSMYGQEVAL
tara:strand:+ start:1499 stop:1810 length:312 start_codon:yes stop_codon:yes gene_type:complete